MNFILWIIIGGLLGALASISTKKSEGIILNIIVGILGSLLSGWFLSPLLGIGTINQNNFNVPSLFVSFLGALILLVIVNFVKGGVVR